MKKSITLMISLLVGSLSSSVQADSRADIGTTLAQAVSSADQVKFITKFGKETAVTVKQNPSGLAELGQKLAGAQYHDLGLQWHASPVAIEFWKHGLKTCTIRPNDSIDTLGCEIPELCLSDYKINSEVVSYFNKWTNQVLLPTSTTDTPATGAAPTANKDSVHL